MAAEVKETLKKFRENQQENIAEEELAEELGSGVEPEPKEVVKPDVENFANLDFSDANSIKAIVEQVRNLPKEDDVTEQLKKIDAYEAYAKKIWQMKKSEQEIFDLEMRTVEKVEKKKVGDAIIERLIWKRDDKGKILTKTKKFYYTGVTLQEKDQLALLQSEMQVAHFAVIEEGARINKMVRDVTATDDSFQKYVSDKTWQGKKMYWEKTIQDYYIAVFQAYFGASDEDIRSIIFDDIVNYAEVALYIGGVKSPK
jgi:hypothetical protein